MASILELMYLLNFHIFLVEEFTNGRKHTKTKTKKDERRNYETSERVDNDR